MRYYLQNKHRGYLGNAPVWWAKGGQGYTAYLERAERMTKEDADLILKDSERGKFAAYECDLIDRRAHLVFDSQEFLRIEEEPYDDEYPVPHIDAREVLNNV